MFLVCQFALIETGAVFGLNYNQLRQNKGTYQIYLDSTATFALNMKRIKRRSSLRLMDFLSHIGSDKKRGDGIILDEMLNH